jgi:hypothetical protein
MTSTSQTLGSNLGDDKVKDDKEKTAIENYIKYASDGRHDTVRRAGTAATLCEHNHRYGQQLVSEFSG